MKDNVFINGPINTVRLEGEVNGIKKVLYVFMDNHMDVTQQTKCEDVRSKDIHNYLVENFDKISQGTKIYDFFLEMFPTYIYGKGSYRKNMYLLETRDVFLKSFVINKKKNVVGKSNNFPNVRLHYIDIRDYLIDTYDQLFELDGYIDNIIENLFITRDDIDVIRDSLSMELKDIKTVYDILYRKTRYKKVELKPSIPTTYAALQKYKSEDYLNKTKNFIDKIKNRYEHKDIKHKLNGIIDNEIQKQFQKYYDHLDKYYSTLGGMESKVNTRRDRLYIDKHIVPGYGKPQYQTIAMLAKLSRINAIKSDYVFDIFVYIMDVFFMRRFLDKDYVTNAISYTGSLHSDNYIYFLVKYFDFKITHYSYLKGDDIDAVTKIIKKTDNPRVLDQYFYPPILRQCSDMSDFPKLFE